MSASGNELGDLLVDIGIITPEELASAITEQAKSGERLTAVLDKLGLVNHNQLKDSLELQFGVNFVDLVKHAPPKEVADLVSEELKRKHRFIPTAANGTQFTVAMVNPDDLIALDILRVQLRSGHLKKTVCTADDLEYCLQQLYPPQAAAAPSATVAAAKPGKVEAKKHLRKLFDDDDDDDLDSMSAAAARAATPEAPVQAPVAPAPAPVTPAVTPAPQAPPSFAKLPDDSLVELPSQAAVAELTHSSHSSAGNNRNGSSSNGSSSHDSGNSSTAVMEPKGDEVAAAESNMEAALANVTSALIESSQSLPINNDANRQLLEEVVQSELGDIEEADIQSMKEAQNASVMLLAHEIIGKASQKRCSDIHLEPDKTGVALRYFLHGELLADCILPLEIHRALVGSYKIIAGLDPKEINKPQDKKFTCMVEEDEIELRITTLPSEIGEMVAISMRYPD
jgi:type II secretory ATPase GspE/PulE/Tfp pilus assembly ATPase PilB-like protein